MEERIKKQLSKALVEPWIEALRSGEYTQGMGSLAPNGKYCCLGVYNRIHGIDNQGPEGYSTVQDVLGSGLIDECMSMNDHEERSFSEIADYIERNYELV